MIQNFFGSSIDDGGGEVKEVIYEVFTHVLKKTTNKNLW